MVVEAASTRHLSSLCHASCQGLIFQRYSCRNQYSLYTLLRTVSVQALLELRGTVIFHLVPAMRMWLQSLASRLQTLCIVKPARSNHLSNRTLSAADCSLLQPRDCSTPVITNSMLWIVPFWLSYLSPQHYPSITLVVSCVGL